MQSMVKNGGVKEKITVIIPSYNRESLLPRALKSVLAQTWTNFEVVIVDDGSTDSTEESVKPFLCDKRLKYLKTENHGVSHARNVGIAQAQSQWLAFLDSDDEWLPEKLDRQMSLLSAKPYLNWIHGEEIWVRHGKRVNPMLKHKKRGGDIFADATRLCCVSPSTVILKRELFDQFGLFREDFPVCEDYDLWLKISSCHKIGFVEKPVIKKYGGHDDQLSHRYFAMDYWRILALDSVLQTAMSLDKKEMAKEQLLRKTKILLNGYRKHQNLTHFDSIFSLMIKHSRPSNQ